MATFSNGAYVEPGIYVETQLAPTASVGTAGPFVSCFVGTVDPYTKVSTLITRSGTGILDTLTYDDADVTYADIDVTRDFLVQDVVTGRTYNGSLIDFPNTVAPVIVSSGGAGSLGGTFTYTVVAIRDDGAYATSPLFTKSADFVAIMPSGGTVTFTYDAVTDATKYRLYRQTSSTSVYFEIAAPTVTITDDGSAGTAGSVPAVVADYFLKNSTTAVVKWTSTTDRVIPAALDQYQVTFYDLKSASDYDARIFYSGQETEMYNYTGTVTWNSTTSAPTYTIPVAVQMAFANGASAVWIAPRQISDTVGDMLTKVANIKNPLPYALVFLQGYIFGSTTPNMTDSEATSILSHVLTMSSLVEQKERIAIFGPFMDAYTSSNFVQKYNDTSALLKSRRTAYMYPSNIKLLIEGTEREVDGFYLAAAIAGLVDSVSLSAALSGQVVADVSEVIDEILRNLKNQAAQEGALMIEDNFRVRHALTTDTTNVLTRELKTTRIVDYITRLVRDSLSGFVNQSFAGGSLLSSIAVSVKLLLAQTLNAHILADYSDVAVSRNSGEPNQVDVSFRIQPEGDANWIYVKITVEA